MLAVGGPESRRLLTFIGIWVHRIVPSHLVSILLLIMVNKKWQAYQWRCVETAMKPPLGITVPLDNLTSALAFRCMVAILRFLSVSCNPSNFPYMIAMVGSPSWIGLRRWLSLMTLSSNFILVRVVFFHPPSDKTSLISLRKSSMTSG